MDLYIFPVIIAFIIILFVYLPPILSDKNKNDNKNDNEDEDKNKFRSEQRDDFIQLFLKVIIYSARYCGCKDIDLDTIAKTDKFIHRIDPSFYSYRVSNLKDIIDTDINVTYSDIDFLCREITKRNRRMSLAEDELFLDALFSAIYHKKNHLRIINLLSSLQIINKVSLNKVNSKYENIYRNKHSSEADSYFQKEKEKQQQKEKEEKANNNKKIFDLTLELLVEAMKVDRSKMVCELDVIKYYILENDKEHFQERVADVKKYLSYEYIDFNVEKICDKINKELRKDYRKREDILKIVIEIIYADETCTNVELNFLNKVAERLKVSKSSFDFIRMKFENRQNKSRQNKSSQNKSKRNSGSHNKQQSNSQNNNSQNNNSQDNNSQNGSQPKYSSELEKAYAALGINKDATDKELSACWRNLMRVNHPDLMESRGPEAVRKATERCQEINKAFEIVKASRGMR